MPTRDEARKLVEQITQKHGYVRLETLEKLSPEDRREIEMALLSKDHMIASSVMTLAQNLYSDSTRFVFELLQNADDNHYTKAKAKGEAPWVSFHIYENRIVIECNEDGFTPDNLTAICNIGKSSKTGAQGYIGEKGFGFKSVFAVAQKVYIQSGNFAFFFQHRRGDSGIGMITPIWENNSKPLGKNLTRITLDLHAYADVVERQRERIRQQFQEIHETVLLFMKNLHKINIHFYGDDNRAEESTAYSISHSKNTNVAITKTCTNVLQATTTRDTMHYHVTRQMATNLARSENRKYSKEEEQTKAYAKSEVVLAFPLTDKSVPIIDDQWLFAFLPVRQMGFKFVVQADFVTQANREDVVTTSSRNEGLINAIAEAFVNTVLQFCKHKTLQYQWMKYLPRREDRPWGRFWGTLVEKIESILKEIPVLRGEKGNSLHKICDLRRDIPLDQSGKPLFLDIDPICYPSLGYESADLEKLHHLGLQTITPSQTLDRIKADLAMPNSRMKYLDDEDWHSRVTDLLRDYFQTKVDVIQNKIRELELVPLVSGVWVSAASQKLYFPYVSGVNIDIPTDLHLSVLSPAAIVNPDRKRLFELLDVDETTVAFIRRQILDRYRPDILINRMKMVGILPAVSHLRFLYLTHDLASEPYEYETLPVFSQRGRLEDPRVVDIHIPNDDPYGASILLRKTTPGPKDDDGAPGFPALYMQGAYFKDAPDEPTLKSRSWPEWLHEFFSIRRYPRLISPSGQDWSEECEYILEHRLEKFLGYLQRTWEPQYGEDPRKRELVDELRETFVLCEGGEKELSSAYYPTVDLQSIVSRFMMDGEAFPWLELESDVVYERFPVEWEPLGKVLGLGFNGPDVDFALTILEHIKLANPDATALVMPERVYHLYGYLQAKFRESLDPVANSESLWEKFNAHEAIFIPQGPLHPAAWASPNSCVWSAPVDMAKRWSLEKLYAMTFQTFGSDRLIMEDFFQSTLGIADCDWRHITDEIQHFKATKGSDSARIKELYGCLSDLCQKPDDSQELRKMFEDEGLICRIENDSPLWYKTSQCLWSSTTKIRGRFTLNDVYGDLEDFFVSRLGVETMTAEMVYDKLIARDGVKLSFEDAKETIFAFNSFLQGKERQFDPDPVRESEVFPVRLPKGKTGVWTAEKDFVLVDRESLGKAFTGKAALLGFSLEEIGTLEPFIKWAYLQTRYISEAVKEKSHVSKTGTRLIYSRDREMRMKAHELLRISKRYNSPRFQKSADEFYTTLRNIKTFKTDEITSVLSLTQDGRQIEVIKERATLHIDEGQDGVTIYVPEDSVKQDICFGGDLPTRLARWIMTDPSTGDQKPVNPKMTSVIQGIVSANSLALPDILEHHGIESIKIEKIEPEWPREHAIEASTGDAHHGPSQPPARTPERRDSLESVYTAPETPISPTQSKSTVQSPPSVRPWVAANLSFAAGWNRPIDNLTIEHTYTKILTRIVDMAKVTNFPHPGKAGGFVGWRDFEMDFSKWDHDQQQRDTLVGAAGELLVFEVLSNIRPQLPHLSRETWQSNIRQHVAFHPKYTNMEAWEGNEMADIVYLDSKGVFTKFLIRLGYLGQPPPCGPTPTYFIEVKTTMGPCSKPFFVSKAQYDKMHACSYRDFRLRGKNAPKNVVYVIIRVFNIGKDSMGYKIYVDPLWNEELVFETETWKVVEK